MSGKEIVNFCRLLLEKAEGRHGRLDGHGSEICERIIDLNLHLEEVLDIIEDVLTNHTCINTVDTLDFDDDNACDHDDISTEIEEEEDTSSPNSEKVSQEWELYTEGNQTYSLDRMQNIVNYYDGCKNRKLEQTKMRYKYVNDRTTIARFREYINANGRKIDKLKQLELHVLNKFLKSRLSLACVSERDLKRWGMQKARELELNFQASSFWVHTFKKKCRIVSRKITKLTTEREITERDVLYENGRKFVENVKTSCSGIPSSCIFNFDQSGFNYNHTNLRTLSNKGEKETKMIVHSIHAATHYYYISYSIMPLISMDGVLASKLLICLQEKGGSFGPRVKSSLKIPSNIYISSSRSGKLDKGIMREWVKNYVVTLSGESVITLIYDSWAGQTDESLYEEIPNLHGTHQIPAKTTQWVQPLDCYFFRQYKLVKRRICDRVILDDIAIDLEKRDNIILLHSLIYNQFQAPVFQPMLKYSWYKCGYTDNRAGQFMNANEILFDRGDQFCDSNDCENDSFIRCSHCGNYLCISHFLLANHYHALDSST